MPKKKRKKIQQEAITADGLKSGSDVAKALPEKADLPTDEIESDLVQVVVKTVADIFTQPAAIAVSSGGDSSSSAQTAAENINETTSPPTHTSKNFSEKSFELYLYAVRADFVDDITGDITRNCKGCGNNYYTLNQIGIALAFPLPTDIFGSVISFNIRESEGLKVSIDLLECRKVSAIDLGQMQRFHRFEVFLISIRENSIIPFYY